MNRKCFCLYNVLHERSNYNSYIFTRRARARGVHAMNITLKKKYPLCVNHSA